MLTFDIRGIFIKCIEREVIPSGTIGAKIKFVFDDEWQSFNKTVTFDYEDQNRNIKHADLAFSESEILIPPSVVASPGRFRLGIYGANGGSIATPTLYSTWLETPPGAVPSGITPEPPSTLVNQIYDIASSAESKAQSAAETSQRAVDIASETGEQAAAAASSASAAAQSASNSAASASSAAASANAALSNANAAASSAAGAEAARQQAQATADSLIVSNPNLLDNWYFGDPVDQRGGYVVYAGANLYSDASCTTIVGTVVGGPYAARAISAICVSFTSNATYYCKIGDTGVVRGYTGGGYGIDRWKSNGSSVTVIVEDDEIQVIDNATDWNGIFQLFENWTAFAGKTVTLSALGYTVGAKHTLHLQYSDNTSIANTIFPTDTLGLVSITTKIPDSIDHKFKVRTVRSGTSSGNSTLHLKAAKLELGTKQTLAYQDSSGNWVLNELPNYADTLARCQRYFQTFATESLRPTDALDFRPVMRANPALSTITVGGKTLYTASADL